METMILIIERTPRLLRFKKEIIGVEQLSIRLPFARKPCSLYDMSASGNEIVYVTETVEMTPEEFDAFASDLTLPHSWLKGKGGSVGEGHLCIEIHAPGRPYLYVDPSGGDCARYTARLG